MPFLCPIVKGISSKIGYLFPGVIAAELRVFFQVPSHFPLPLLHFGERLFLVLPVKASLGPALELPDIPLNFTLPLLSFIVFTGFRFIHGLQRLTDALKVRLLPMPAVRVEQAARNGFRQQRVFPVRLPARINVVHINAALPRKAGRRAGGILRHLAERHAVLGGTAPFAHHVCFFL